MQRDPCLSVSSAYENYRLVKIVPKPHLIVKELCLSLENQEEHKEMRRIRNYCNGFVNNSGGLFSTFCSSIEDIEKVMALVVEDGAHKR